MKTKFLVGFRVHQCAPLIVHFLENTQIDQNIDMESFISNIYNKIYHVLKVQ